MIAEPLYHPNISHGHSFTNVLLVDKRIADHNVFVESVNSNTFPIAFSVFSSKTELTALLQTYFTHIERLAIAFTTEPTPDIHNYFLDNSPYFTTNDISIPFTSDATQYSENVAYLIHLVNSFHIKNLDFLGCNTLQYDTWTTYYDILTRSTGTIVGASNDATGNIKYGGNWTLENTSEEIETVYFTSNIQQYQHLLDWATQAGYGISSQIGYAAMVAINSDGRAIVWGHPTSNGGNPSAGVLAKLTSGCVDAVTYGGGWYVLKNDGTVVGWESYGADISIPPANLNNAVSIKYQGVGFCAFRSDGTVYFRGGGAMTPTAADTAVLQSGNVSKVFMGDYAVALILKDGSVYSWGGLGATPSIIATPNPTVPVVHIVCGWFGLAAIRADGMVVAWGNSSFGMQPPPTSLLPALSGGALSVTCSERARAVLKSDGSVVAWGDANYGGDTTSVSAQLTSGVVVVHATQRTFIALKSDGTVVSWPQWIAYSAALTNIVQIVTISNNYMALRSDGTTTGGTVNNVGHSLTGITAIVANGAGFMGLKSGGRLVSGTGVDYYNYQVVPPLTNVTSLACTGEAWAALTSEGKVVTWGRTDAGGNSSSVASLLSSGIVKIFAQPKINSVPTPSNIPVPLDETTVSSINASVPTDLTPDVETGKISITIDAAILTTGTDVEKSQKRTVFLNTLFTNNAGLASSPNKITMTKEQLLGTDSIITKTNLVIQTAANIDTPVEINNLDPDEGLYVYMGNGDFTVFATSAGNLKIQKVTEATYDIYENYVDANSPVTKQMLVGESDWFGTFYYVIGGITAYIDENGPPICFPKGTPVTTNQGDIAIDLLNPAIHTIRGKKIVAITPTRPVMTHIVSIEKDALAPNVPSANTRISNDHKILYNGKMTKAIELIDSCTGVTQIPYNGETLYNVLMETNDTMMINNLICETLDPGHIMAIIYGGKYNSAEKRALCAELSTIIKTNSLSGYKDLCRRLNRKPSHSSGIRVDA